MGKQAHLFSFLCSAGILKFFSFFLLGQDVWDAGVFTVDLDGLKIRALQKEKKTGPHLPIMESVMVDGKGEEKENQNVVYNDWESGAEGR